MRHQKHKTLEEGGKNVDFGISSNLSCYQLKIYYIHKMIYVNLAVTTKQKFMVNTQNKKGI